MLSAGLILERVLASTPDDPMPTHRRGFYQSVFGDLSKLEGSDKDLPCAAPQTERTGKGNSPKSISAAVPKTFCTAPTAHTVTFCGSRG